MSFASVQLNESIRYEFDLDDEDDHVTVQLSKSFFSLPSGRKIAGNKRVAKYRDLQGFSGTGQVMQSITATPAHQHTSFEELRLECYLQTLVAKGGPPTPVNSQKSPWQVIPPIFNAFYDTMTSVETLAADVTMTD